MRQVFAQFPSESAPKGVSVPASNKRRPARRSGVLASAVALAGALALTALAPATAVPDAVPDPDLINRAGDGSVDLSAWTATTDDELGKATFVRNGINYQVEMSSRYAAGPLVANRVTDLSSGGDGHTYSYRDGTGHTSSFWLQQGGSRESLSAYDQAFYSKSSDGGQAVAQEFTADTTDGKIKVSEVLRVESSGQLVHHYTLTNVGATAVSGLTFGAELDTELDGDDWIPLIKSAGKSIYIENSTFRLYLSLIDGDRMMAGDWTDDDSLYGWQEVNTQSAGQTIVTGVDSAIEYQLVNRTIPVGQSITMTVGDRIYEEYEVQEARVNVVYWDDELGVEYIPSGGKVVLTGEPLDPVSFTAADAQSHLPAGYILGEVENDVTQFDDDNSTDQQIKVHVTHEHEYGSAVVERTIAYEGGGENNPEPVTNVASWTFERDLATGAYASTSTEGFPLVVTPQIDGLIPSLEQVDAQMAMLSAGPPADFTVTVTYSVPGAVDPAAGDMGISPAVVPGNQLPLTGVSGAIQIGIVALVLIACGVVALRLTRRRQLMP